MRSRTKNDNDIPVVRLSIDCFSVEPEKRSIELAFLQRLLDATKVESAAASRFGSEMMSEERISNAYAQMRSPVFIGLASILEKSVPEEMGFGKFSERD